MAFELSERQQSTAAAAITIVSACVILVAIAALFWLLGAFFARFSLVFLPLAVAAVAALVFKPYMTWLRSRLRLPPVAALVVVFLSILIPVAAFSFFFGALVTRQVSDMIDSAPIWWNKTLDWARENAPRVAEFLKRHEVVERLQGAVEEQQAALVGGLGSMGSTALAAGRGVMRGAATLLAWAVFPIYFSFFLMADSPPLHDAEKYLPFLKRETRQDVVYLVREFVNIIVAFFRGQLIIAFLQGLLFAVGFSVAGLKYGFVIGLVLGFLNIIPYLGNIIGLATALPLAFFQDGGGLMRVVWVLLVFAIVQMVEGYLLTPKIMGDRTGLHPMVIIIAIFFWGSALSGILGMILAIPLTAFLVVFWRLAKEKYVQELV